MRPRGPGDPGQFAPQQRRPGLTGFLYREDGVFYQWLKGPAQAVADTFAIIKVNPRHRSVKELSRNTIIERRLGSWSMSHVDGRTISLFDWAAGADASQAATISRALSLIHI